MFSSAREEIIYLQNLLKEEKQEDLRQYNTYIQNASLTERRKQGVCWYPLFIKETGYGLGEYPFLVVERTAGKDEPHVFGAGKAVAIFSNNNNEPGNFAAGTIHFVSGNTMKIILHANDFPDWFDDGKLGVNLLFDENSYKEMERALKTVAEAENNRLADLRDLLLGYKKTSQGIFQSSHIWENNSLNSSQNKAVEAILQTPDICVIHGPPGTGKTTTLVAAIEALASEENNILVCAPSNAAADLLTEKIAEQGISVVRIGNLSRIDENIVKHSLESKILNHADNSMLKNMRKQAEEFKRMALKYKRQFGKAEREQRNLLLKEARNLTDEVRKQEKLLIDQLLSKTKVVCCTLVGSMNRYIENRQFGTVIIDEAAQALEPANWVPIVKAKKVILAGDPFQLPPTVKNSDAAKKGLNKTLVEKCLERVPEAVHLLDTQYRMNEKIMGFSNSEFYGGKLKAAENVKFATLGFDDIPFDFIDTAGAGFEEKNNPESQSIYNPGEANILFKHLEELLQKAGGKIPSIGIISPYREQVVHLNEAFLETSIYEAAKKCITINTIDSFQGQERDVIYISLVRSNENGEIGFLNDFRRMNVALTRARKKLVIIGDSATLGHHAFYLRFLEYAEANGNYFSAWLYM